MEALTLLSDLARACAGERVSDDIRAEAVPRALSALGAIGALVLQQSADGYVVADRYGVPLDAHGIETELAEHATDSLLDVPVPGRWDGLVDRVAALRLPGHQGVLVVAWAAGAEVPEKQLLDLVSGILTAGLAWQQAEEDLADLRLRVNNAQALANMGDYDWHIATNTNTWSDQLYRIYGHEPQSFNVTYESFLDHVHPDDRERIQQIHQQAYATGEPYQMVERIVRPDGELRYLSSNGQVVKDENGTPLRFRGTCIDVTDRVLAEQAKDRSAARFRALVERFPDAVLVVDGRGMVVQGNRHADELLGEAPIGRSIGEIMTWPNSGHAVTATGLDGRPLRLDIVTAELSAGDEGLVAVFLRDAAPRLASEATAASLREAQVRRRQALEINDNVVQGLAAAVYCLNIDDAERSATYLEKTLTAARRMMNDLLAPLDGTVVKAGDLVRATSQTGHDGHVQQQKGSQRPSGNGNPRVLIADDYVDVRSLLRLQLEAQGGFDIVGEASDGEEAVQLAAQLQPDVVLLDLRMPKMDGLQALPLILEAVEGVRVIVLSGFDEHTMAEQAIAAGADRYVEKGLRMDLPGVIDGVLKAS